MADDPLLSRAEAAALIGVAPSTLSAYVSRSQAPGPDTSPGDPGHPRWRRSTLTGWVRPGQGARTDRVAIDIGGPGRHVITHGGHTHITDDPSQARRITGNLAASGTKLTYTHTPDVTCLHVAKPRFAGPGWQWWSDQTITRGHWTGEHHRILACEPALALLATAVNAAQLPPELPGILAAATAATATLVRQHERTVRGWTTETTLRHHHVRCETAPAEDGTWREYGIDLWTVTVEQGGHGGEDGDGDEHRLLFVDEREALAAYLSASGEPA